MRMSAIHIRRTKQEPDNQSALADCYCGRSAYQVKESVTYDNVDLSHNVTGTRLGSYCKTCLIKAILDR